MERKNYFIIEQFAVRSSLVFSTLGESVENNFQRLDIGELRRISEVSKGFLELISFAEFGG